MERASEGLEWSQSESLMLVQEYESRPLLWNKRHPMHRVASAKHRAWADIASTLDCTTVDVRRKINSLLASFRRVRAKVKETGKTPWFLYPHMKFLHGYVEAKVLEFQDQEDEPDVFEGVDTLDRCMEVHSDGTNGSGDDAVLVKDEPIIEHYEFHPNVVENRSQKHGKKKLTRTIRKRRIHNTIPQPYGKTYVDRKLQEIQMLVKLESNAGKKDDCDSYGEYIASTLRKYDSKAQCMIKQAINTLLYEQEMNRFENTLELEMVAEHLDPSDDDN